MLRLWYALDIIKFCSFQLTCLFGFSNPGLRSDHRSKKIPFLSEENLGASPQLECWNNGIMGFGQMGQRLIGKIPIDGKVHKRVSFP